MTARTVSIFADARIGARLNVRWLLIALWTSLFLLRGALYLIVTPPWQAPDEPTSFELLLTMEARGRLVSIKDMDLGIQKEIIASMERTHYWEMGGYGPRPRASTATFAYVFQCCTTQLHRPPLYHLLLMPAAQLTQGWPVEQRLIALRAVTLLLGAITVAVATIIGMDFARFYPALPLIFPALVAFHPQFTYSNATFNGDNLVATLGALLWLVLLRLVQRGLHLRYLALMALLVVLGFFTKRTVMFLLPSVVLAVGWQTWRMLRGTTPVSRTRTFVVALSLLVGVAVLLVPDSRALIRTIVERYAVPSGLSRYWQMMTQNIVDSPVPFSTRLSQSLLFLNQSFWGSYGWHRIALPANIQYGFLGLTAASWISVLVVLIARRARAGWSETYCWLCAFAVATSLVLVMINVPYPTVPQGRYLFPVLVPMLLLLAVGVCSWWPRRWLPYGVTATWLALVIFDVYSVTGVLVPGFYR